jgi:hypothetical protein
VWPGEAAPSHLGGKNLDPGYPLCIYIDWIRVRVVSQKSAHVGFIPYKHLKKNGDSVRYSVFEHFHDESMAGHRCKNEQKELASHVTHRM